MIYSQTDSRGHCPFEISVFSLLGIEPKTLVQVLYYSNIPSLSLSQLSGCDVNNRHFCTLSEFHSSTWQCVMV